MSVQTILRRGWRELGSIRIAIPAFTGYITSSAMTRHERRGQYAISDVVLNSADFRKLVEFAAGLPTMLRNEWTAFANVVIAEDLLAGGDGRAAVAELVALMPSTATLAVSLDGRSVSEQIQFANAWQRDRRTVRIDGLPPGWGLEPGDVGAFDSQVAAQWIQEAAPPPPVVQAAPPMVTDNPVQIITPPTAITESVQSTGGDGMANGRLMLGGPQHQTLPTIMTRPVHEGDGEPVRLVQTQQFGLLDGIRNLIGNAGPAIGGIIGTAVLGPGAGTAIGSGIGSLVGGGGRRDQPQPTTITPPTPSGPGGNLPALPFPQPGLQTQPPQGTTQGTDWRSVFQGALNAAGLAFNVFMTPPVQWPGHIVDAYNRWRAGQPVTPPAQFGPPASTQPVQQPGNNPYSVTVGGMMAGFGQPIMEPEIIQTTAKAPPGYVTVTLRPEHGGPRKVWMEKPIARKFGYWKPRTKPVMTGADVNAINRAERAVKRLQTQQKKVHNTSKALAALTGHKVVDKRDQVVKPKKRTCR